MSSIVDFLLSSLGFVTLPLVRVARKLRSSAFRFRHLAVTSRKSSDAPVSGANYVSASLWLLKVIVPVSALAQIQDAQIFLLVRILRFPLFNSQGAVPFFAPPEYCHLFPFP